MNEKMNAEGGWPTLILKSGHFSERRRGALGWDHVQFDTLVRREITVHSLLSSAPEREKRERAALLVSTCLCRAKRGLEEEAALAGRQQQAKGGVWCVCV